MNCGQCVWGGGSMTISIGQIQGEGHISPFVGLNVTTTGIVTAVGFNGYYLQDEFGDGNDRTSDGIYVFAGVSPSVSVGDKLQVTDVVSEFIPGGSGSGNLSITQLSFPTTVVLSTGNALPDAVLLGENGRQVSDTTVISDDEYPVNLQDTTGVFNPETDAIDFWEALEGMRVTIDDPVAISATRTFSPFSSEVFTLADDGSNASGRGGGPNDNGGLDINADADGTGDLNPERIQIQFDPTVSNGAPAPEINTGDKLGDVTGVVGYSFGNFEVVATEAVSVIQPTTLTRETTAIVGDTDTLTVATYNVLNLDPSDITTGQYADLAVQIVNNLQTPDIIALQEIQDNNGSTNDGTVDADQTLQLLVDQIVTAGGPTYSFFDAEVVDGGNGGIPGGNIRNAFLYDSSRVSLNAQKTLDAAELAALGVSDPDAFLGTRDPLLADFSFNGEDITIINNHLTSRFGSTPIFGGIQPFVQAGEVEREAQTKTLNEVVDGLVAGDPLANVVVLGDLNTFEFTDELSEDLPGVGAEQVLTNLIGNVQTDDAYSFNFEGNSQALDHVFVSNQLVSVAEIDYVHTNVDFFQVGPNNAQLRTSDHEPIVVGFDLRVTIEGTGRNEKLQGTDANDILHGKDGNDRYVGNDGSDIFRLGKDDLDQVLDFQVGLDLLDVSDWGTQSFEELQITGRNGRLTVQDKISGDRAMVRDTQKELKAADLTEESFIFAPIEDLVLTGTGKRDDLAGRAGNDVFDGGLGPDVYEGNGGSNTFVLWMDARDTVTDYELQQSTRRYLRRRAKRIRIEDSQQKGSSICSFSSSPL